MTKVLSSSGYCLEKHGTANLEQLPVFVAIKITSFLLRHVHHPSLDRYIVQDFFVECKQLPIRGEKDAKIIKRLPKIKEQ